MCHLFNMIVCCSNNNFTKRIHVIVLRYINTPVCNYQVIKYINSKYTNKQAYSYQTNNDAQLEGFENLVCTGFLWLVVCMLWRLLAITNRNITHRICNLWQNLDKDIHKLFHAEGTIMQIKNLVLSSLIRKWKS